MTAWPPIAHSERLIVVVGPSGAGKDSVLQAWAALRGGEAAVHTARRVITRPADGGVEQHEAVSADEFSALSGSGAFATAWQAHGLAYGVRHRALAPLATGGWVLLNGSRAHLPTLRQQAPRLRVVEITAPPAVLAQRLARRGREDEAAVTARLQRQVAGAQADLTLVNDSSVDEVARGLQRWFERIATA
ncbi:phosphonate metabolism protein/1,5-bisphosphokinase (PRPP-forming) PhnN [Sphaerotilaceae bacterium SBD11-9]